LPQEFGVEGYRHGISMVYNKSENFEKAIVEKIFLKGSPT